VSVLLSISGVAKRYGRRRVLRGVTFYAERSEIVGIIGPNGAGKTTLLRIITGLLRADEGSITLDDVAVPEALTRVRVGYFAGESTVPPSVRSRRWRALFHPVDSGGENRPVRLLSRGTRQLLGLRTLFSLPALQLIVLDEPWEGLDPDATRWLSESIRARRDAGAAVLVSSHRLHDLAGVCNRYLFLDQGTTSVVAPGALAPDAPVTGETLMAAFDRLRGGSR
jgi:ABC-type multidrug transport system ATPase subunit